MLESIAHCTMSFQVLRQEWKSGSISVHPGHRVTLCQFIEELKLLVVVKCTIKRRKASQVQLKHSKRAKQEETQWQSDSKVGSVDVQSPILHGIVKP